MTHANSLKPNNRIFTKRLFWYFFISLIIQSITAYGALIIFNALPSSIVGLPDDDVLQRNAHQGTVFLIKQQIKNSPELTTEEVLANLQPEFGLKLSLITKKRKFPADITQELAQYGIAYDDDEEMIYARLDSGQYLQLGPLVGDSVLDSHILPLSIYLILFAGFSAMTFCTLLYFSFSYLWRDAKNMSATVDELSKGNLKVRAKPAQSWLFKQLAGVINTMCDQIEKLISSNRIILHAMAHELRTPLARMNFEVEILTNTHDETQRQRLMRDINNDIKELEVLINTSLSYFKIQQTQLIKDVSTVSVNEWAIDIINNLELLKPQDFELTYQFDDEIIHIDKQLVETIIKNLLLNSFKYAASKASIKINQQGELLFITVDDDGPGIPPEARESVFLPFSRIDTSRTKSTGGYGLGLAYVKLIAESCQGKAFVMTSPLGGARFVVTLNFS
ncbi:ATP-binding protein [Orbus mooreae]|uniref:ATP-binding protein n=1 Tax=Orbus mooreae TaxID=3074107 RepID=UPI00370D9582